MLKTQFTTLLCFWLACTATAQYETAHGNNSGSTFQKVITTSTVSIPSGISRTSDNGYILSGEKVTDAFSNADGLLLKLNRNGRPDWARSYDNAESDYQLEKNAVLTDGSIVTVGNQFDGRANVMRVNKWGYVIWQKKYSITDGGISLNLVKALPDGNFAAAGSVSDNTFIGSTVIVKFNRDGGIIWKKVYDLPGYRNTPVSIDVRGDALVVGGIIPAVSFNTADTAFLLKINSNNGAVNNARKIWVNDNAVLNLQITTRSDNQLVLSASFSSNNTGVTSNRVTLLNGNLGIVKSVQLNNIPDGSFSAAAPSDDKGVVLVYNDFTFENGYLIKFSKTLQPVFARSYPKEFSGSTAYQFTAITTTDDDGFIATGTRNFADSTAIYLVKTDKNGNTGTCGNVSADPGAETLTIDNQAYTWSTVYGIDVKKENMSLPGTGLNASETDLCRKICYDLPGNITTLPGNIAAPVTKAVETEQSLTFKVTVRPNPSSAGFTLDIAGKTEEKVTIIIRDSYGRLTNRLTAPANQSVFIGGDWKPGVYIAEMVQGGKRQILRLVKL